MKSRKYGLTGTAFPGISLPASNRLWKWEGEEQQEEQFTRVKDISDAKTKHQELLISHTYGFEPSNPVASITYYIQSRAWWQDIQIIKIYPIEKNIKYGYRVRAEFIPIGFSLNKYPQKCYDFFFKDGNIYNFQKIY